MIQPSEAQLRAFDAKRQTPKAEFASLCYAPFTSLSLMPDGNVAVCCASRNYPIGNLHTSRLSDIWRGGRADTYRQALSRFEFPTGCERCAWMLGSGRIDSHKIRHYDHLPVTKELAPPKTLEFAMSNTCNFACVMCDSFYSSAFRVREGLPPIPNAYNDQFFADLASFLPTLESASFLGSEPFLQQECFRVWDMLIADQLHPVCSITTNGTVWNTKVERVLNELPADIAISVDGITKATIEATRCNAKFETLIENIERFNAYAQGNTDRYPDKRPRTIKLNYCIMPHNWHELADFFLFAEDIGTRVWTNCVVQPHSKSLLTLSEEELSKITLQLQKDNEPIVDRLKLNRIAWDETLAQVSQTSTRGDDVVTDLNEFVEQNRAATDPYWRAVLHEKTETPKTRSKPLERHRQLAQPC